MSSTDDSASCTTCPIGAHASTRRRFIGQAARFALSLGLVPATASAADLATTTETFALDAAPSDRASERRYPVPASESVQIDRDNSLILARVAGRVYAFSLACPHQNTALRWESDAHEFRCPKHKSRYRPDGGFIDGRATRPMDRLPLRREGEVVVVDVDEVIQQDEQPAKWGAAYVEV